MFPARNISMNSRRTQAQEGISTEISAGNTFMLTNAKSRAYWNFETLTSDEDTSISSHTDLRGNGWTLDNNSSVFTPKSGYVLVGQTLVNALKANTSSGIKQALRTTTSATSLLLNSFEVWFKLCLVDGQGQNTYLCGITNGSTKNFSIAVNTSGNFIVTYAAQAAGLTTFTSSGSVMRDGYTGVSVCRVRMDFTTDVVTGWVNGIPVTFSETSGNAMSTWNPANFSSAHGFGIGGMADTSTFTADSISNKYFLKAYVSDLLTDAEALNVGIALLN